MMSATKCLIAQRIQPISGNALTILINLDQHLDYKLLNSFIVR